MQDFPMRLGAKMVEAEAPGSTAYSSKRQLEVISRLSIDGSGGKGGRYNWRNEAH